MKFRKDDARHDAKNPPNESTIDKAAREASAGATPQPDDNYSATNPPDESTIDKAARQATGNPSTREPQPGPHRTSNEQTPALPQPGERDEPQRAPTQRMRATQTTLYQGLPYYEGQEFNAQMGDVELLQKRYRVELINAR